MKAKLNGKNIEVLSIDLVDDHISYETGVGIWNVKVEDILKQEIDEYLKAILKSIYPEYFL